MLAAPRLRRAGPAVKTASGGSAGRSCAPVNVSLEDKFAQGEPHDSAISFTNLSRALTNRSRYPRFLWISLSKNRLRKSVRPGFLPATTLAQKLGTEAYVFEIMRFR
jgi:hypothetical protein